MKLTTALTADQDTLRARFLAVKSPQELASLLEVPYSILVYLIYRSKAPLRYREFSIPKRSGGVRIITTPTKSLKILQSKLSQILQLVYKPKPAAHGFLLKRSIVSNAQEHCKRRLILNIDLHDFFPSINFGRVRGLFIAKPYGLPESVATVIAQICCFNNQLPQGAPTSPIISNMVCSRLDTQLQSFARTHKLTYTRYADDITLSTFKSAFPDEVCSFVNGSLQLGDILTAIVVSNGFDINNNKVHLQRWDSHQEVTGLTVNRKPNVRRSYIRQIRAMLHAWKVHGLEAAATHHFRYRNGRLPEKTEVITAFDRVVRGKIAYLAMVRGKDALYQKFTLELDRLVGKTDPELRDKGEIMNNVKIFVSHSARDVVIATALVQCLEACLEVYDGAIRCTSVPGYKLDPGSDANEVLRNNLEQCSIVIGLLTRESLQSGFVIMELGAAWGLRKMTYPVLGPGVDFGQIPGPLKTTHAIKTDSVADIAQLISVIGTNAALKSRNTAKFTTAVQAFVDSTKPTSAPAGVSTA